MNHNNNAQDAERVHMAEMISALADGQLADDELAATVRRAVDDAQARARWHAYHVIGDVMRRADLAACCAGSTGFVERVQRRVQAEKVQRPLLQAVPQALAVARQDTCVAIDSIANSSEYTCRSPVFSSAKKTAANADTFRWKVTAGVASVAAVAALGWQVVAGPAAVPGLASVPQLAQSAGPVSVSQGLLGAGAAWMTASEAQVSPVGAPANRASSMTPSLAPSAGGEALATAGADVMLRDPQLDELLAAHRQLGHASALQMPAGFLRNATAEVSGR